MEQCMPHHTITSSTATVNYQLHNMFGALRQAPTCQNITVTLRAQLHQMAPRDSATGPERLCHRPRDTLPPAAMGDQGYLQSTSYKTAQNTLTCDGSMSTVASLQDKLWGLNIFCTQFSSWAMPAKTHGNSRWMKKAVSHDQVELCWLGYFTCRMEVRPHIFCLISILYLSVSDNVSKTNYDYD